ncbi:aldehyde dehydrogenase family protein [Nakamurella aerolata]|uniref:Aldehyde dehydrogenase family protein n=1 Tax=Nakamurella aerolata TaxID=1656892 RepID=A0A849A6V5_9ACTN|nr:aldehyde dehydrogenase family protein [Nakamurella aerolata]NNG36694.1 aldehyde dehydrogenase family protein [Nakamurella aerolata]
MRGGPLHDWVGATTISTATRLEREQLVDGALAIAARLAQRGGEPGDRIGLLCRNGPGFVAAALALMHADASIVLIDPTLDDRRVAERCHQAGTDLVVSDTDRQLAGVDVLSTEQLSVANQRDSSRQLDVTAWWRRSDALVVFSSGTTGTPCAIVRPGPGLRENLARTQRRMGYRTTDVLMPLLPYSHQYGFSMVLLWWLSGCALVSIAPQSLGTALQAAAACQVTVVDATPASYHSLLRLIRFTGNAAQNKLDLSAVRMWCVGGSPVGAALRTAMSDAFGRPLLDGYGSSELGNIALADPQDPIGCGRPLDGVSVQIVDEDGSPVAPGTVGRILVASPDQLIARKPVGEPWQPVAAGYFATGDLGRLDEHGRLTVIGRAKAVHRLGHTLYPEAIAARAEVCGAPVQVIADADERTGSRLTFVVAAEPDRGSAADWRRRFCSVLDRAEWPNRVLVVDRFPTGSTGKPSLDGLRELVRDNGFGTRHAEGELAGQTVSPASSAVKSWPARAQARWDRLSVVADRLEQDRALAISLLTAVVGHQAAADEVDAAVATLRGARDEVLRYQPGQIDRLAVFMPSNIPLYSYVLHLLVPSLYTDRIAFRPSSHIRDATVALHEYLSGLHGLDIELSLQTQREFLTGPVANSDVVVFTGTYANAERIRDELRPDQLMLFFGQGVNPVVVGTDADLAAAVADVLRIRMINNGQDCFGPDVILVHDSIADEFVARLQAKLTALRFGEYADPTADYGPLLYEQAFGGAVEHLQRMADTIVHGGAVQLRQRHLEPTVLRRPLPSKLTCEELFAPIFNVVTYPDDASLHRVLRSPYFAERAMGAMVYGCGEATVELLRERHHVCVETTLLDEDDGNSPFGGRGIRANYIAVRGARYAEPLLLSKAIAEYAKPAGQPAAHGPVRPASA